MLGNRVGVIERCKRGAVRDFRVAPGQRGASSKVTPIPVIGTIDAAALLKVLVNPIILSPVVLFLV